MEVMTIRLTGKIHHLVDFPFDHIDDDGDSSLGEGDIVLFSMLDSAGRANVRGRHTNYGYSGFIDGRLIQGGRRRRIVNWKRFFPNWENCFATQGHRDAVENRVVQMVTPAIGSTAVKVKGGWRIDELPLVEERIRLDALARVTVLP